MKACGLIVEYNPLHNGHLHHITEAKKVTNADVIIAVMSGSFLQRGEPAIIDKIYRTKAALDAGADLVLELPYPYAVQSSELFAKGAINSLVELGATSFCFGSEKGLIEPFIESYYMLDKQRDKYNQALKVELKAGQSFPTASSEAYKVIGLDATLFHQPNNILGLSYVNEVLKHNLPIKPFTIKRINNDYHDEEIVSSIASATSIRNELLKEHFSTKLTDALPAASLQLLQQYYAVTGGFHEWESYFPFLHYKVLSMSTEELQNIHGVEEGLEHRLKDTANHAKSFADWLNRVKTRRYTQTHLQRVFTHILTNSTKTAIKQFISHPTVPYIRILGMNSLGQQYVGKRKKAIDIPIITRLTKKHADLIYPDEKATDIYYSILTPAIRKKLKTAELTLPIRI